MEYAEKMKVRRVLRNDLFNEALEYAILTGDYVRLELGDEYFDSREAGLVWSEGSSSESTQPTSTDVQIWPKLLPVRSSPMLSPKTVRVATKNVETKDTGVQCMLVKNVANRFGTKHSCSVCDKKFDTESRQAQKLLIGCMVEDCDYRLHAACLLGGPSPKITPTLCKDFPYECPYHRT